MHPFRLPSGPGCRPATGDRPRGAHATGRNTRLREVVGLAGQLAPPTAGISVIQISKGRAKCDLKPDLKGNCIQIQFVTGISAKTAIYWRLLPCVGFYPSQSHSRVASYTYCNLLVDDDAVSLDLVIKTLA